jgi:hypothetical protein
VAEAEVGGLRWSQAGFHSPIGSLLGGWAPIRCAPVEDTEVVEKPLVPLIYSFDDLSYSTTYSVYSPAFAPRLRKRCE